jgi:predicted PurR-regulated permease PerM
MLTAFIRAQLSLAALSLVAYTVVLLIARFPFSFAIAAIGGALEFIPLVGALTSGILMMGVALVTGYRQTCRAQRLTDNRIPGNTITSPHHHGRIE